MNSEAENLANTRLSVSQMLAEQGETRATLVTRLNEALQANLAVHLAGGAESPLAKVIAELELPDFVAIKDITLREFATHALRDRVSKDEALREEYEQLLTNLPDDQKIDDLLQLGRPLDEHPLFTDLVRETRLNSVLALTPLGEQAERVERFKAVLDRCGGLHAGFWQRLAEEALASPEEIEDIKLSFDLTALAQENVELAQVLKARPTHCLRDLIPLDQKGWLNLLKEHRIAPPESFVGDRALEEYAIYLESAVAEVFPTETFFDRLLAQEVEAFQEELACVEPFLRANPGIALEQEIPFRKVHWPSEDRRERARVKRSLERLRKGLRLYGRLGLAAIVNDPQRAPADKVEALKRELAKLGTFLQNNPRLDLRDADFHRGYATAVTHDGEEAPRFSWDGLAEADQAALKQQLMVYQRLFRLHPRFKTAQVLLEDDLDSAHKIILMTEKQFVERYTERLSNPSPAIPQAIYSQALGIAENTLHQWANVKDLISSPAWQKQLSNNTSNALQQYYQSFQSYQDMFGSLNFYECDDCQSIFGPAAYFVDLMRFIDLNITQSPSNQIPAEFTLKRRRPDLWQIPLDCEHTTTLVSYLDITNEILAAQLGASTTNPEIPYKKLLEAVHPFSLPFNRPLEEMRIYLSHFRKTLSEIYKVLGASEAAVAAEYLSLSKEEQGLLRTYGLGQNDLAKIYGIDSQKLYSSAAGGLARVKTFMQHTGLSRTELDELLCQDLSQAERASNVQARFFINKVNDGLGPLSVVTDTETDQFGSTVLLEKIANFSERKLNNIHRFIRLATKLGWTFADLDWVLWSVGGGSDPAEIGSALTALAKIKEWQDTYDLPLDVLCSFWYRVKAIGQGETPKSAPLDLFNRLFNHPDILKGGTPYDPAQPTTWQLNSAADGNRNRLLAALEITDEELDLIVEQVNSPAATTLDLSHENLSRLYRFSRIPKALDLDVKEFIWLLGLMQRDGLIATAEIDSLPDFEKLVKVTGWLETVDLSIYELHYLLTESVNPYVDAGYTDPAVRLLTEELAQEFRNALIKSAVFTAIDGVDQSQAAKLYAHLVTNGFLVKEKTGARLADTFTPEAQGFTLGLPPALVPASAQPATFEKQVIELLKGYDEKKIALKRLAVFFNVEPDLLKSVITFAAQTLEGTALLSLLSTPIGQTQAIPQQILAFLRPVHVRLSLAAAVSLSTAEVNSIVFHPEYYNIGDIKALTIADIETLYTFKQLTKDFNDTSEAVIDYFKPGNRSEKIKRLAKLTRWDTEEVKLLFDRFWPVPDTNYSHVPAIHQLEKCFNISLYMGLGISPLLEWVKVANGAWADCIAGAKSALEILKAKYSETEWKKKYEPLADKVRTLKRDALASYAIWNIDRNWSAAVPRMEKLRDLYAYLLIDVEMTSCATTSRIAQGIATLQLYIQRCQMNLEPGVEPESVPTKQWEWMKNYRVWEANRKVFLYPENYIEPELRDDKSPIFKELEDELLQGEMTDENVEKAYRNYLNKFAELANLKIAGSYHDTATDTLYLLGRTNTQPYTYYYRVYKKQTTWTAWERVNLSIKAEVVSPVFAFERLFIFWVELSTTKESKIEGGNSKDPVEKHKATIKYSFYDFNKSWMQPQTLAEVGEYEGMLTYFDPKNAYIDEFLRQYWQSVYPASDKNDTDAINLRYGGVLVWHHNGQIKPFGIQGFWNGKLHINLALTPLAPPLTPGLVKALRPSSTKLLFISVVRPAVDSSNLFSEASFLSSDIDVGPFQEVEILGNISDQAVIRVVNNSQEPNRFIFDQGDEIFLVEFQGWTPFWQAGVGFTRASTYPIHNLSRRVLLKGIKGLLCVQSQQNNTELDFSRLQPHPYTISATLPYSGSALDFTGAYGHYYWEVFFHTPFLVADSLNTDQKFSEAQKWYHYLYNPTIQQPEQGEILKKPSDIVWRFLPFRDLMLESLQDMLTNQAALAEYHQHPFKPHAIARLRWSAYQKAIVMRYIDNLLDWGDYLFAQDTREAISEATQLYILAYNLLGPRPEKLGAPKPSRTSTYEDIEQKYKQGSLVPEFLIELENSPIAAGSGSGVSGLNNAFCFYFCVPENEDLVKYWDRVESSLNKIRTCLNIKGMARQLALYSPAISPMALVQAAAAGRDISSVLTEIARSVPLYRFTFMLEKAKSLCATVQQLGSALLSALEKRDAEGLALLRSTHEKTILRLTTTVREDQRDEAAASQAALLESKASATTRKKHYRDLIQKGLSSYEEKYLTSMFMAWFLEQSSSTWNSLASLARMMPQLGSPFAMTFGGREIGAALSAVANYYAEQARKEHLSGSMSSAMGVFDRRNQDWALQEQLADHDLDQIDKQLAAAKLREQIAKSELEIHEKNIAQTDELYEFLRDKFSSKDLYQWLANQLSGLYFQTYKLAYDLAKSAEKAYQYERDTEEIYINFGHWDSLKKGLLAGERLMLELSQLEKVYLDNNTRPFEIEKTISLAQLNPLALIKLKTNGICQFQLKEGLFDYDFPGHYCRKIKTIALSIPAIVGPYETIKATLTQTSHRTLLEPDTTALNKANNTLELDTGCESVRSNWIKNQQIAISRGVNDSGMFELNFRDERYLPFEGTGAVSDWELEMPKATNRIDFDSISDVIIHLKYTAHFDGVLRTKIQGLLTKTEGCRILSLKHEFSTAWHRFMNPETGKTEHELKLNISEKLFPPNATHYKIKGLYLKVDLASGILPLGNDLKLTITPAKANKIQVAFKEEDTTGEKQLGGASALGEWGITVDRKDGIPVELQRMKDGNVEIENILGNNCYYLDSEKVKNLGLLLLYEADIQWPGGGN